ncbi:MAG: hypothetical protein MJY81_03130 [Bacteroidaceae bacterium]|nr:hypothetical protein [Bacteroidaceae bacterium]
MADISNEIKSAIRNAAMESVSKYQDGADFQIITDIHLNINEDTGELSFYDDDDAVISSAVVEEWIDTDINDYPEIIAFLREILKELDSEKVFNNTNISKPFTFVLEDSEHETIEELFFVDDDNIIITDDLLQGLDKELDDFLSDLMDN